MPVPDLYLVTESLRAWQALGRIRYGLTESETKSLAFRRSLYIVRDLEKQDDLRALTAACAATG